MHLAVQRVLAAAVALQLADDLLDLLAAAAVGHQHRIGGLDHDHVVHADHADQPARRVDQRIAAVAHQRIADAGVAAAVLRADLPYRVPGAEVRPAGVERHHAHVEVA